MKHAFDTPRLTVFTSEVTIGFFWPVPFKLFVAFPQSDSVVHTAMPVVTALVRQYAPESDTEFQIQWLETAQEYRRHGFATEVLHGLHRYVPGKLRQWGATEAGEAFCEAFDTAAKS